MSIVCHLRDWHIQTPGHQPQHATSVFGDFVNHPILTHQEQPTYSANEEICNYDKQHHTSANRAFIIHSLNDAHWAAAFARDLQGHAVLASTQRVYQVPAGWPEERIHPCEWTPEEFATPPARLAQWFQQLLTRSIDEIDWELLRRDDAEPLLAFRLLCEAKKECNGNPTATLHGIVVQAPVYPDDWLAPFGETDPAKVACQLGDEQIQTKAKAVLEEAAKANNDIQLIATIDEFLQPVAPAASN